jgi:N-acetylmuramoyl-L-alanine amidase
LKLASTISKHCVKRVVLKNRGVKRSGFFVLRNTLVPSVLIEVGFITNKNDAGHLKHSSYRQDIAEMIADGVRDYIRSL